MLTLTRKTEYALIALSHLTQHPEDCTSARCVAARYRLSVPLLMNVLKLLTQRGLAVSVRGPRGGYRLAVDPHEITLDDVVRAVEGPVQLVLCEQGKGAEEGETVCELMSSCPVRSPIRRIQEKLDSFFKEVSLADLVLDSEVCPSAALSATQGD